MPANSEYLGQLGDYFRKRFPKSPGSTIGQDLGDSFQWLLASIQPARKASSANLSALWFDYSTAVKKTYEKNPESAAFLLKPDQFKTWLGNAAAWKPSYGQARFEPASDADWKAFLKDAGLSGEATK